jgi:hypothetical protein
MPHIKFALSADGMALQAMIGLNGPDTIALVQAGQPVPRPVQVRALIDPGSDRTAAAPQVFQQLGLVPFISGTCHRTAGSVNVNLYRVSLTISDPGPKTGPTLALSDLLVSEFAAPLPNIDTLIGMDLLHECLLVLDGPGQQFLLGF